VVGPSTEFEEDEGEEGDQGDIGDGGEVLRRDGWDSEKAGC